MKRRDFVMLAAALAAPRVAAQAPTGGRPARIAILDDSRADLQSAPWQAFRSRLLELGYVEGRDVVLEFRHSQGSFDRLPALAAELIATGPDVIVALSTAATRAAMRATDTVPIVFVASADPVGAGLVQSLARPGANVTGQSIMVAELGGKWIELLKEFAPAITRLGFFGPSGNPAIPRVWRALQEAGRTRNVDVRYWDAGDATGIKRAFAEMQREAVGGFMVANTSVLLPHLALILDLASAHRLPAVYPRREYALAGGLASYGRVQGIGYRRTADYVDRILKGARPAGMPVERPTVFELLVNLRTARALGLAIPQSVLLRADRVIE